ncbi:potassium voltage-gated channel subfamily V member 2-like [Hemiscyllium ocellatum]|uniref:potassium voltage-gated channel subfamily V member 2-like n=1 Tax=Hemiscyllium ocellatum TaxID=170820 RepID=UPI002966A45D|nr:potassium voltage-gated channel subfamily V member 2-like [Hemiscyllium ocellatum]
MEEWGWSGSSTDSPSSSSSSDGESGPPGDSPEPGPGPGPEAPLRLNVGGMRFVLGRQQAALFPGSRLGKLAVCRRLEHGLGLADDYSADSDEFFFDRDPAVFREVWQLYRSGRPGPGLGLGLGPGLCSRRHRSELRYWGVPRARAPRCCRLLLRERRQREAEEEQLRRQLQAVLGLGLGPGESPGSGPWLSRLRGRLWQLLERPPCSVPGRLLWVSGCLTVLLSITVLILGTVPELSGRPGPTLWLLEAACSCALSAQLLLRLLSAPEPRRFLLRPLNLTHLLALLPFYSELAAGSPGPGQHSRLLRAARPLRVLRVLTLARYSTGLRAFGFTLRRCSQQACCLLLFMALGIFTFSALVHQAEHHLPGTNFSSIPAAWWWAAVSISTVGYGDITPESLLGRVFAFACIFFGIILNGMPISMLFNKFSDYYAKLKALERASVLKERGGIALKDRARRKLVQCCENPASRD